MVNFVKEKKYTNDAFVYFVIHMTRVLSWIICIHVFFYMSNPRIEPHRFNKQNVVFDCKTTQS